jgi:hypothetical protein
VEVKKDGHHYAIVNRKKGKVFDVEGDSMQEGDSGGIIRGMISPRATPFLVVGREGEGPSAKVQIEQPGAGRRRWQFYRPA